MCLVKETKDLSTNIFPPSFFMVHDARRSGQNNVAKLRYTRLLVDNHN